MGNMPAAPEPESLGMQIETNRPGWNGTVGVAREWRHPGNLNAGRYRGASDQSHSVHPPLLRNRNAAGLATPALTQAGAPAEARYEIAGDAR